MFIVDLEKSLCDDKKDGKIMHEWFRKINGNNDNLNVQRIVYFTRVERLEKGSKYKRIIGFQEKPLNTLMK